MQNNESLGSFIWGIVYPILMFIFTDIVVSIVFFSVEISSNYLTLIRSAILIPISCFIMKKDVVKDFTCGRPVKYTDYDKRYLLILPLAGFFAAMSFNEVTVILVIIIQAFLQSMLGSGIDLFSTYNSVSESIYSGTVIFQLIATAVIAPVVEELIFRGLIFKRLRIRLGFVPSALVASIIFGVLHGNFVQFVYAFFMGLFFSYVYEKYKTIWAPIIFHSGANFISVILTLVLPRSFLGNDLGTIMLLIVVELAITFLLLWLVETKIHREPVNSGNSNLM